MMPTPYKIPNAAPIPTRPGQDSALGEIVTKTIAKDNVEQKTGLK
jgi:hypothetical protein